MIVNKSKNFIFGSLLSICWCLNTSLDTYNSHKVSEKVTTDLISVFQDFGFIGSNECYENINLEENVTPLFFLQTPSHSIGEFSYPRILESYKKYVFHYHGIYQNQYMFDLLQSRLLSKGIKVTFAEPINYRYVGSILFVLAFECDSYKGYIFNSTNQGCPHEEMVKRGWEVDDFTLVIQPNN